MHLRISLAELIKISILFTCTLITQSLNHAGQNKTFLVRPSDRFPSTYILTTALEIISATTYNLKSSYSNNELHSAGDVALTFLESIPIVGDIVSIFKTNPENHYDIDRCINAIRKQLREMDQNIISTGVKVDKLSKQLDLSLIQTQVAEDVREIQNCHSNFLLFLANPTFKAEQERLVKCYDKFEYTRQIGNILNDKQLTFSEKPLYVEIIDYYGYCNGSEIQSVFKYLLGLYIEGCTATVAAEALKYNKESRTFQRECKQTIERSQAHLPYIFKKCAQVPCENVYKVIGKIAEGSDISRMSYILNETFPWFFFTTLLFNVDVAANLKFFEGKINHLVLTSKADVYRVVLWQSFTNSYAYGGHQYGVEYDEDAYREGFNHIKLKYHLGSKRSRFLGFHHGHVSSYIECNQTVNVGDLGRQAKSEHNSLSKVAIAMIAVGSILFAQLVLACICAACDDS